MLNHLGTKELETERLILRKFNINDAVDMFENWASDPEVAKYLTWPAHENIEITKKVIGSWIKDYDNLETYQWVMVLKETGKAFGSISLMNVDNKNENCEIGYCIGRAFWNKGYVTEALNKIILFAFKEVGFQRITGRHNISNPASGRVMEKCGFQFEGVLRKINRNGDGTLVDCKYYSILKDEVV